MTTHWVWNRKVFRCFLKENRDMVWSWSSEDRLFQVEGPEITNPLSPRVLVFENGTTSWPAAADRSWDRPGRDDTDVQCLDRYPGADLWLTRVLTQLGNSFINPLTTRLFWPTFTAEGIVATPSPDYWHPDHIFHWNYTWVCFRGQGIQWC